MAHKFDSPIKSVAVVGAGASGCPAARHLRDAGFAVRVFERQPVAGGIWNWRAEAVRTTVPTPPPSLAAFIPTDSKPGTRAVRDPEAQNQHSPPNPMYWSLTNNVPTSTMVFKDFAYPQGTKEIVPHYELAAYVHAYVRHFGLDGLISFNTRVERVVKTDGKWRLRLRKLADGQETIWDEQFDAVVIATGHYNAPFIPDIPGLVSYAQDNTVLHSTAYRVPDAYAGKEVMIVGVGTSGVDIARDLAPHAARIYMVGNSISGPEQYRTQRQWQRKLVPSNGELVPEIRRFVGGRVELVDGRDLRVDAVIFATGYQYSFPFLPALHADTGPLTPITLVTDGRGVYNLYRDVFYVPDPTLAFVGLSVNTSAFSFFEYQSISVARVLSEKARLPDLAGRLTAYAAWVAERGEGKFSHLMGQEREQAYVAETVDWLNAEADWSGAARVEGHSEAWKEAARAFKAQLAKKYGLGEPPAVPPPVAPQPLTASPIAVQ